MGFTSFFISFFFRSTSLSPTWEIAARQFGMIQHTLKSELRWKLKENLLFRKQLTLVLFQRKNNIEEIKFCFFFKDFSLNAPL